MSSLQSTALLLLIAVTFCLQSAYSAPQPKPKPHPHPQYQDTFLKTNLSRSYSPRSSPQNDQHDRGSASHQRHSREIVQTTSGPLKGIRRVILNKEIHVFYGVPFAKPPLGPLRFKKPVPIDTWNGTFNAFHQPNTCFQEVVVSFPDFKGEITWLPNTNISEDCLYMNIWVPKPKRHNKKFPILVWIYGGGYVSGTATLDIYNADILAAENNVIVVVPQYRVGAFGFLYFGHEDAPGNMGLYDQVVAIEWIKANAARFGGDPDSITVFGESAGGGSVTFHLVSPVSRHLLNRGIIQSGTINAPWSIMTAERAKEVANKLVDDCNCTNSDNRPMSTEEKIECLRNLPAKTISVAQWNSYSRILNFFSAPTIDGEFLPKDPMEMLEAGDFKKVPLLIGSNKDEGTYFILYDFIEHFKKDEPVCLAREIFLDTLNSVFGNLSQTQRDAIRFQYTHWEDIQDPCKIREKFVDFVGDYYFICPTNRFAEAYAKHDDTSVYYYFFTQRTSTNPWGDWMGVMHADEIEYVFGVPLNNTQHSRAEQALSKRIMKYFTLFAETGVPVDEEIEVWPKYTKEQPNYFILNAEEKGTGKGPRSHTCAFWNEFMPLIAPVPGECDYVINGAVSGTGSVSTFVPLLVVLSLLSLSLSSIKIWGK